MFLFSLVNIGEYGMGAMFWLIVSGIAIYYMFKGITKGSNSSSSTTGSASPGISPNIKRSSSGGSSNGSADPLKYAIYTDLTNKYISSTRSDDDEVGSDDFEDRERDDWDEDDEFLYFYNDKEDDW